MTVEIYCRKNNPVQLSKLKKCLEALLIVAKKKNALLEVNFVGDKKIQDLNSRYRNKLRVTDVLSFPQDETPPFQGAPWHLGEIFIATPVAKRQAEQAGRTFTQQAVRLAVHGFVHLHGMDHESGKKEQANFEKMEKKYLNYLKRKGLLRWDGSLQF